jgi:hypothetical protein
MKILTLRTVALVLLFLLLVASQVASVLGSQCEAACLESGYSTGGRVVGYHIGTGQAVCQCEPR